MKYYTEVTQFLHDWNTHIYTYIHIYVFFNLLFSDQDKNLVLHDGEEMGGKGVYAILILYLVFFTILNLKKVFFSEI
jgi:hypothetical protein